MRFLDRYAEPLFAVFRFVFGLVFSLHGMQKIFGAFGSQVAEAPLMLTAGWIELVGGWLIALGLFTRVAAFIASGEMAVAYFMAHFPRGFWPVENDGEPAALYCFAFLFIAAHGGGRWSLDRVIFGRRGAGPR